MKMTKLALGALRALYEEIVLCTVLRFTNNLVIWGNSLEHNWYRKGNFDQAKDSIVQSMVVKHYFWLLVSQNINACANEKGSDSTTL